MDKPRCRHRQIQACHAGGTDFVRCSNPAGHKGKHCGMYGSWSTGAPDDDVDSTATIDLAAIREVIGRLLEIVSLSDKYPEDFYSFDLDDLADKLATAIGDKP